MKSVFEQLAQELNVRHQQVNAAVQLLDDGATVPFIARYRKEATGNLTDEQLRTLEERLTYLRDLEKRREAILQSIESLGKLTPELREALLNADTKARLEDLYLPYKPKRRTKAQVAREAGLEPLALSLLQNPTHVPEQVASRFINPEKDIPDAKAALNGATEILMEMMSEDAELVGAFRTQLWRFGILTATVMRGKKEAGAKFSDYFDYSEPLNKVPSHRALAILRGRQESILKLSIQPASDDRLAEATAQIEGRIARKFRIEQRHRPADNWLLEAVSECWRSKLLPHLETELINQLKDQAEEEAIRVFARNLKNLLLSAPAGPKTVMGLDPGLRTGVKVAVIDPTGQLLATATIYPHPPQNQWQQSLTTLATLAKTHGVSLISIGNGTASRETERLAQDLIKQQPDLKLTKMVVSEAGASVYSASALATEELPNLDVSLRGAVSIARRLQDPLAELVKIDPKAIGVGQYQHDVNQTQLSQMLDTVVEDCVNAVGVDVNMASPSLLTYVSGLSKSLAKSIVDYRNQHGPFPNRDSLKKVPKLGPKAFEQSAGFLRIMNGSNPLDASAVHPEAYPVVERIVKASGRDIKAIMGDTAFLKSLNPAQFTDTTFGLPTVQDILSELDKPGRDPRPEFRTASFKEGVETLSDLKPDMVLEGVVTNVTNFGAFVDIGVHQDGLVHISMLADTFVKDPHAVVKTGDIVRVKVLEVDIPRKRISLTMRFSQ